MIDNVKEDSRFVNYFIILKSMLSYLHLQQICEKTKERTYLENLLNKTLKIEISDGRTLIGSFLCTDKDRNVVLGSCQEFVGDPGKLS